MVGVKPKNIDKLLHRSNEAEEMLKVSGSKTSGGDELQRRPLIEEGPPRVAESKSR